jgi:hypothetical protein
LYLFIRKYRQEGLPVPPTLEELHRQVLEQILSEVPAEELLKRVPPEKRLEGLSPEQRLEGLSPEQRRALLAQLLKEDEHSSKPG